MVVNYAISVGLVLYEANASMVDLTQDTRRNRMGPFEEKFWKTGEKINPQVTRYLRQGCDREYIFEQLLKAHHNMEASGMSDGEIRAQAVFWTMMIIAAASVIYVAIFSLL